ncbi:MAG TPA: glycosyltransferase, partial [Thermoplasmata archaeon]
PIRGHPMRVAILHDHLRFLGGGERLVLTLAEALGADLYVTDCDPAVTESFGVRSVSVTELAKVPKTPILRQERQVAAFRRARVPGYDIYVFSGNWAIAAAARHHPNLWYCHTPVRVFYDLREAFLDELSPPARLAAQTWIRRALPRYERHVTHVQRIVANSRNVEGRVKRYLHRRSTVVYPPVDTERYHFRSVGEPWLSVNRLSHEKRLGLQVEAFRRLPEERLIVVGGPQVGVDARRFIRSLKPPRNVTFLGEIGDGELRDLFATCRGLVATSLEEDFGLTPVEAMASGKCVVAVDEGGYRETIVPEETGWLVPANSEALADAIRGASTERLAGMRAACERQAARFDRRFFLDHMRQVLDEVRSTK